MEEKGYIQYTIDWNESAAPEPEEVADLIRWRQRLYEVGLMGVDANGVGFGNISERATRGFLISATQTGLFPVLTPEHFSHVTDYDIAGNWLQCEGKAKASSEALSHAILYEADSSVRAVIHVHSTGDWERLRDLLPTTAPDAEAGTVRMAEEIGRLFDETELPDVKVLVMGGHREGLISFGQSLDEAGRAILGACAGRSA